MQIKTLEVGQLGTNCYIVFCDDTREGVVIDPGGDGDKIIKVIEDNKISVKYIINTHGNHDHTGANRKLKEFAKVDLLIHEDDSEMLTSPKRNFSIFLGENNTGPAADGFLKEDDLITFGNCQLRVIH